MEKVIIRDDFIKLGQAMKLAGMVGSVLTRRRRISVPS